MVCALLLMNAVLPLRGLWFYDSLLPQLGSWILLPTYILFPHLQLIYGHSRVTMPIALSATWKEAEVLFATFALIISRTYTTRTGNACLCMESHVLSANPNTAHTTNSLYEVAMRVYAARTGTHIASSLGLVGSPLERLTHTISSILFLIVYALLCLRALFVPKTICTPSGLLRWLALVWLFYCLLGTPWFWSWYSVTFFGLFALIEVDGSDKEVFLHTSILPLTVCALTFTMLSVYCFYTWAPHISIVRHVFHSQVLYMRGLWIRLLPGVIVCAGVLLQSIERRNFAISRFSILPRFKHMLGLLR